MDERGERVLGDSLVVLLNAHHEPIPFHLPPQARQAPALELLLDTADPGAGPRPVKPTEPFDLKGRAVALFRWRLPGLEAAAGQKG